MAEAKVEDVVVDDVVVDDESGFEEGFSGVPTGKENPPAGETPTEGLIESPGEKSTETPPAEEQFHQLTEAQWQSLQAMSTQIDAVRADGVKWRDTAFGKVGGLERTLQQLQAATPSGFTVDVTDDIVADLAAEFPEVSTRTLAAFKVFASKIKGTGPAAAPAAIIDFEKEIQTRLVALQVEALEDAHPTWREITGEQHSNTPYRQWLAAQPAEYQKKLNSTNSAQVLSRSIEKFEAAAAAATAAATKAKEEPSTRKQQLAAAAVVRGAGGRAPTTTDEDQFTVGFESG